jgi:hypothetical protein
MTKNEGKVEVQRDGERYVGQYCVRGGLVTVSYAGRQTRPTQTGGSSPEAIVQLLLLELVDAERVVRH